jgi:hypothetical protein
MPFVLLMHSIVKTISVDKNRISVLEFVTGYPGYLRQLFRTVSDDNFIIIVIGLLDIIVFTLPTLTTIYMLLDIISNVNIMRLVNIHARWRMLLGPWWGKMQATGRCITQMVLLC